MNLAKIGEEFSWTNTEVTLRQIEKEYGFPLVCDVVLLLICYWNLWHRQDKFRNLPLLIWYCLVQFR